MTGFPAPPGSYPSAPLAAPYAQPVVRPKELRPPRWWYWVAGVLGLAGAVAGVVSAARGFNQFLFVPIDEFELGEEATFDVDPDDPVSLYARERDDLTIPGVSCAAFAEDGGSVELEPNSEGFITNADGSWGSIYNVEVSEAGRYTFECEERFDAAPGDLVGLGPWVEPQALVSGIGLGGLFASLGLGAALVICLIVGIRRASHKRRLLAERQPPPPPPGWGAWAAAGWYTPAPPPSPRPTPPPSDFTPPG